MYTVKEKGGKPDRKPFPLPYGVRDPHRNLKNMPKNLNEIVVHEFCFYMNFFSCGREYNACTYTKAGAQAKVFLP
jgi:hypothetical protein